MSHLITLCMYTQHDLDQTKTKTSGIIFIVNIVSLYLRHHIGVNSPSVLKEMISVSRDTFHLHVVCALCLFFDQLEGSERTCENCANH